MSAGTTASASRGWFRPARPLFQQFVPTGQDILSKYMYDTPARAAGEQQILSTVGGEYLRPESNPYLQSTADAISRNALEFLQKGIGSTDSTLSRAGKLYSTQGQQLRDELTRKTTQDVTDRLTGLFGGNYATERRLQAGAAPQAIQVSDYPLDTALRIASLLGGLGSSRSSSINAGIL
mgnify:CR=1 FL=1